MLQTQKTIQAIGVLARTLHTRRMNYMRMLKLLYIADRESLADTGHQITGDRLVAMDRGPVLSGVKNLIDGKHVELQLWQDFIRTHDYHIRIHADPGVSELSEYEISKLQEIAQRHRLDDEWAMVRITHRFQEWIKNHIEGSSRTIPLADILDAVNQGAQKEAMMAETEKESEFDRIFGN